MPLYTLFLATIVNVNKPQPVQAGLTLDECVGAAQEALRGDSNFANCRPAQPEKPVIFVKVPSGQIVQVERQNNVYVLPASFSAVDREFVTLAVGRLSSSGHTLKPTRPSVARALVTTKAE